MCSVMAGCTGRLRTAAGAMLVAMAAAVGTLGSCGKAGRGTLPGSGGRPYEVLLVAGNDTAAGVVRAALQAPVPALPQQESAFDVVDVAAARFEASLMPARNIVVVNVDSRQFTATRMRYANDVHARPQTIIYINTPSATALSAAMKAMAPRLRSFIGRTEMAREIVAMRQKPNLKAQQLVAETVGCGISLPRSLVASKQGKGFVWLSDNRADRNINICVYSYPGTDIGKERFVAMRDSVMRVNIPGEQPGMYMATVAGSMVTDSVAGSRGRPSVIHRGLWAMHGDAMGGALAARCIADPVRGRVVVAEAFAYAPGSSKRNMMKKAEASLLTLRPGSGSKP